MLMPLPARKSPAENSMEERTARLEATVEHIQSNVTEMKGDLRRIENKVDAVKESVAAFELRVIEQFNKLNNARWRDKVWWLVIASALLGVMARGFKWI